MNIYNLLVRYRSTFLTVFIFFLLFELVIVTTVKYKEGEDTAAFLEFKAKELHTQVRMGQHYLGLIAKVLYDNVIYSPDTAELIYKASQTHDLQKQALLRAQLYKKYEKDYEYMKTLGVRQLHFHLPEAISFLRFHRPTKFGDSLAGVRESIIYVNRYQKPLECFEEGRIFNGFRHVYPIFYNKQFVGTVEISYSFRAFLEHMLEINKDASYLFLVNDSVIADKVFQSEKNNYMRSAFEHYSIDKKTLNNRMGLSLNEIFDINKKIAQEVSEKLLDKEEFTVAAHVGDLQNRSVIASFIAVRNFNKKKVAYMVGYNYSITLDIIHKRSAQILMLLSVLNVIVSLLIFFLLKAQNRAGFTGGYTGSIDKNTQQAWI
ncbi:MAG: cache domain-containing protein [Sulfurimonas sp.]